MKILLVGSGGRENAIAWKMTSSDSFRSTASSALGYSVPFGSDIPSSASYFGIGQALAMGVLTWVPRWIQLATPLLRVVL